MNLNFTWPVKEWGNIDFCIHDMESMRFGNIIKLTYIQTDYLLKSIHQIKNGL